VQNASDYLSLLMGKQPGALYTVDAIQKVTPIENVEIQVPASRADFQAMQAAIAAQDMMVSSGKMSYLPKLNAFGEYLLNDNDAFGFGSDSYLVGAQLSWTIFNGTATQNKIAQHRIERNKMTEQLNYQKEQSQLELNKTLRQAQDARFSLQQNEIAVNQATEALRILKNRYEQGLVATNDILQSQTLLSQQKLNHAQAVFQFNTTQAYLEFLTSTTEK
jgi:outer membrane protein TolC